MSKSSFEPQSAPPPTSHCLISFPAPHVLLVTINRPKAMNSIPYAGHWELDSVFQWFDSEPTLRTAIITGAGDRAFCAGQDLIEVQKIRSSGRATAAIAPLMRHPTSGFAGISRRAGKKPIIAAVNGFALGGGFELVLGCDLVVASPKATFGLPEALRGLYAAAGGLPRLARLVGLPIATEVALTGRTLSAREALELRVINHVSKTHEDVLDDALALAKRISEVSPDAVIVSRAGLREAFETASVERAAQVTDERYREALMNSENLLEGTTAFAQKRKPNWRPSKL